MVWNRFLDPKRYLTPFLSLFSPELINLTISSMFWLTLSFENASHSLNLSFTSNLKIVLKKETHFYRSSFGPSFKCETIPPYHFLLEIFWLKCYTCVHLLNTTIIEISSDIAFLKRLHPITCSKKKKKKLKYLAKGKLF